MSTGVIKKVNSGLYYRPKMSRFGELPPEESSLLGAYLKYTPFLVIPDLAFNQLGIGLTQMSKLVRVFNHKCQ